MTLGRGTAWDQRQKQLVLSGPAISGGTGGISVQSFVSQTPSGEYWEDVGHLLRPCAQGAGRSPALQSQARGVAPILSCQEGPLPTRALPLLLQLLLHFGHRWVQVNLFLYLTVVKFCDL